MKLQGNKSGCILHCHQHEIPLHFERFSSYTIPFRMFLVQVISAPRIPQELQGPWPRGTTASTYAWVVRDDILSQGQPMPTKQLNQSSWLVIDWCCKTNGGNNIQYDNMTKRVHTSDLIQLYIQNVTKATVNIHTKIIKYRYTHIYIHHVMLHYIALHIHTYSAFDQPSCTHPNQSTASNPLPTTVPL